LNEGSNISDKIYIFVFGIQLMVAYAALELRRLTNFYLSSEVAVRAATLS